MDQQQLQKGYEPVPYHQPEQSAYPHPQPPPAYDQSGTTYDDAPKYPSAQQVPPPAPIILQTVFQPQVGPDPTGMTCPSCRQSIVTRMDYETTAKTHIAAVICLCVFWPCAWVPYCMDTCKNANHYCPNCGAFIATYNS